MNRYIYFAQRNSDGLIKIGYSSCVPERMKDLRQQNGTMRLLGLIPGSMSDERRIQKKFSFCNCYLEWFTPSQELIEYIGKEAQFGN